ncbi:NucA/NucB deoxyribonuclease domain-containing protein [Streptodolium elevatio]|uniref:NucA/NucB deoxyribonuclease domain-containing protein n=1 Tax=Streptodolium elevatio TaxID=3157996 RepID=A0ABV3DL92_9ACTN
MTTTPPTTTVPVPGEIPGYAGTLEEVVDPNAPPPIPGVVDADSAVRLETPEQIQRRAESARQVEHLTAPGGITPRAGPTPDNTLSDLTYDQCKSNQDAADPWGLAYSHRYYCSVKEFVLKNWRCAGTCPPVCTGVGDNCTEIGRDEFTVVTIGRISYNSQRKIQFNMKLDDWKTIGTVDDSRMMRLDLTCSGSCNPDPNNGAYLSLANWKSSGLTYVEFNPAVSTSGTGVDQVAFYNFKGDIAINGVSELGTRFADNQFRCDEATYVAVSSGCVFNKATEIFSINRADVTVQETAAHIYAALDNPTSTMPAGTYKKIPGGIGSGLPLTRLHPTTDRQQITDNTSTAVSSCRRYWNTPGQRYTQNAQGVYTYDCDEYPFKTTAEGARNAGVNYSVRPVKKEDNQRAGNAMLNVAFYQGMRVISGDKFYVTTYNPPAQPVPWVPIPNGKGTCKVFGNYPVCGAILNKYESLGGPGTQGNPTGDFDVTPDDQGEFQHFANASSIYWSQPTGAHQIGGNIRAKWGALGAQAGPLGYPTTDETPTPDSVGRFNHFRMPDGAAASIYWKSDLGAHDIRGAIRAKWAAQGWETGGLGYPTTDEVATPDGIGRFNHFTRYNGGGASIYWTPQFGAWSVQGPIRDKWAALGWETGLGYPTTDEFYVDQGAGYANHFKKPNVDFSDASIYWTPETGAWSVTGAIRLAWAAGGWEQSNLGYPVSDARSRDGRGMVQEFSHPDMGEYFVYLTPASGVRIVSEGTGFYQDIGGEASWLGYPTQNSYSRSAPEPLTPLGTQYYYTKLITENGCIRWEANTDVAYPTSSGRCSAAYPTDEIREKPCLAPCTDADYILGGLIDWDRDGKKDIIAKDGSNGDLWLYPGAGTRGPAGIPRVLIGTGWQNFSIAGLGDWGRTGAPGIVARDNANGNLWFYPGEGKRAPSSRPRVQIGSGWNGFQFGDISDYNRDGNVDIVVNDSAGILWLYPGEGKMAPSGKPRIQIGSGWGPVTDSGGGFVASIADWNSSGTPGIVGVRGAFVTYYPQNGAPTEVGSLDDWLLIKESSFVGATDWDNDGETDIIARSGEYDELWLMSRNKNPVRIGSGW